MAREITITLSGHSFGSLKRSLEFIKQISKDMERAHIENIEKIIFDAD